MKKEKRIAIIYILIILLLVSLFVALKFGYLRRDAISIKNKTKQIVGNSNIVTNTKIVKKENIDKDLDVNSTEVKKLISKIDVFDTYKAGSYYGYFYQNDYLDIDKISDDAKIMIGITQNSNFANDFINSTYDAVAPDGNNLDVIILSKDDIQKAINSFFGPNTYYVDTNLKDVGLDYCGFSKFQFDETRNVYMSDPITCSGFPEPHIDSKVISAHQNNDVIEITIKIAYIKYEVISNEKVIKYVYRNQLDNNYIEKHDILTDNSYNINKILDKLDTYRFTFKLNSNNYFYFLKVEKI